MKTFVKLERLIRYSKDLEELDLHNNTVGNMGATIILHALEYRKYSSYFLFSTKFIKIFFLNSILKFLRKNWQNVDKSK
jgi:hypothetical protein